MGRKLKTTSENKNFNFTEEYIQKKLDGFFASSTQKYVMENLYVFGWESDKLIETRSGLIYEFEIKVSKADFKNDFKNKKDKHLILEGKDSSLTLFEMVDGKYVPSSEIKQSTKDFKKPNYFYYAVPEGMITIDEVPEYAGLVYITPDDGDYHYSYINVVKTAPKLHSTKYTDDELKLGEKFYYNMLSWKDKYREERRKQLLSEGIDHGITYAELLDKYEKVKRENKAYKSMVDQLDETNQMLNTTIYQDNKIIREYRRKMREYEVNFNPLDFEYTITDKEE